MTEPNNDTTHRLISEILFELDNYEKTAKITMYQWTLHQIEVRLQNLIEQLKEFFVREKERTE